MIGLDCGNSVIAGIPSLLEFRQKFSTVSSPDLVGGSHYRDPRVKPEDDIVGNFRIPKENSQNKKDKND